MEYTHIRAHIQVYTYTDKLKMDVCFNSNILSKTLNPPTTFEKKHICVYMHGCTFLCAWGREEE